MVLTVKRHICKMLSNTFFGLLRTNNSVASYACFNSVTACGRHYLKRTKREFEDLDYDVLYGDTDSVFIKNKKIKETDDEILQDISLVNFDFPNPVHVELETTGDVIIYGKKNYCIKKRIKRNNSRRNSGKQFSLGCWI